MDDRISKTTSNSLALGAFAVSMGAFEAVLVIYLRRLFYPQGFEFPLVRIPGDLLLMELLRESATILMIAAAAFIAARRNVERFAWFLYIFALWDIFYYVFLKLLIGWPETLLVQDILFLIPVVWVGPVLAPLICSVTMLIMSFLIIYPAAAGYDAGFGRRGWILIISGAVLIFANFISDYSLLIITEGLAGGIFDPSGSGEFWQTASRHLPGDFNWVLFIFGEALILGGMAFSLSGIIGNRKR